MAKKSLLLSADQKTSEHAKRSAVYCLVRQLVAEWIEEPVLARRLNATNRRKQSTPAARYIPFGLEPVIDNQLSLKAIAPVLTNQVRLRKFSASY